MQVKGVEAPRKLWKVVSMLSEELDLSEWDVVFGDEELKLRAHRETKNTILPYPITLRIKIKINRKKRGTVYFRVSTSAPLIRTLFARMLLFTKVKDFRAELRETREELIKRFGEEVGKAFPRIR